MLKSGATRSLIFVKAICPIRQVHHTLKIEKVVVNLAGNIAERIKTLIEGTVAEQGVQLWDVRYVKEGASWYLRIFIDKNEGVTIDDCTNVSHAVDPILDEADIIDASYYLEVCSPGIDRELTRKEHFEKFIGSKVTLTLYKAYEGSKTVTGVLTAYNDGPELETEQGNTVHFTRAAVSKARLG